MDWDNDGMDDIIVGDRNGYINFFKRTGSGVNDLASGVQLKASGSRIDVGANSAPVVVDWNNDGLLDLVVGTEAYNVAGSIKLYLNSGTATNAVFTRSSYVKANNVNINMYRSCPAVYDMNDDGKKDLIVGSNSGRLYFFANTGTDASPVFGRLAGLKSSDKYISVGSSSRLCISDWNEDGHPDMLVSNYEGWVYAFLGLPLGITEDVHTDFAITPAVNPAYGSFNINVQLTTNGKADLKVYDSAGRLVAAQSAVTLSEGKNLVTIDAGSIATGVYTVVATTGSDVSTCRMVLAN